MTTPLFRDKYAIVPKVADELTAARLVGEFMAAAVANGRANNLPEIGKAIWFEDMRTALDTMLSARPTEIEASVDGVLSAAHEVVRQSVFEAADRKPCCRICSSDIVRKDDPRRLHHKEWCSIGFIDRALSALLKAGEK